jgi:hypothetical protein
MNFLEDGFDSFSLGHNYRAISFIGTEYLLRQLDIIPASVDLCLGYLGNRIRLRS